MEGSPHTPSANRDATVAKGNGRAIGFIAGEMDVGAGPQLNDVLIESEHGPGGVIVGDDPGFTWQQLTHHRNGWRQWLTREASPEGIPLAEIIEVGPWPGYGTDDAHYLLETSGSTSLYRSLDDAMRAAEDPGSVTPLTKRRAG